MTKHIVINNSLFTSPHGNVTIGYIFKVFLKIGAISFGGHMALMSMVERIVIHKDKRLSDDTFARAISLATLFPGPMAVNAVTYLGFRLHGNSGAAAGFIAILLPATLMMLLLSWLYIDVGYPVSVHEGFLFTTGVVCATICAVGLRMFQKEVSRSYSKIVLAAASFLLMYFFPNYIMTFALIVTGLATGVVIFLFSSKPDQGETFSVGRKWNYQAVILLVSLLLIPFAFIMNLHSLVENIYAKVAIIFSGLSLSLFGGGYVMVPVMQTLFVNELQWLTNQEFIDAITMSQATPGPILVGATFVGYKLAGVGGAVLATVCIFTPAALLIVSVSKILSQFENHALVKSAVGGSKVVIVGMILASALKLLTSGDHLLTSASTGVIALFLLLKWKVSPVYLIVAALVCGFMKQTLL